MAGNGETYPATSPGEGSEEVLNICLVDIERALRRSPYKLAKCLQTSQGAPDSLGEEETLLIIYGQCVVLYRPQRRKLVTSRSDNKDHQ